MNAVRVLSLEAEVQRWKDNHGLVLSDRNAWKARAEKAEAGWLGTSGALVNAESKLAAITRILIAFHRQEGDGIVSVKRLAKRLHDEQTAGGTRRPAESPADYPAVTPPAGSFSYGGTDPEEAGR